MRILLAGDTHGNAKQVKYLCMTAVAQGCDRVFQLGDFGAWEHMPDGVQFLDDVEKYARLNNVEFYWLDGNHDKTSLVLEKYSDDPNPEGFLTCRPGVFYAPRGHTWEWAGRRFIALGGAYSIDKEDRLIWESARNQYLPGEHAETLWFPEEEMTDDDMDRYVAAALPGVDYILAHDKPLASKPGWNRKAFPECEPNQKRLQKAVEELGPDEFFHGHLHYPYESVIQHGHGMGHCRVTGLNSDPLSSDFPNTTSWHVLDLS